MVASGNNKDRRNHLLESLKFDQIDTRRSGITANHSITCEWLLKHPDYQDWRDPEKAPRHHGFLWIKVISFFFNALFQLSNVMLRLLEVFDGSEHNDELDSLHTTIASQGSQPEWRVVVLQDLLRSAVAKLDQQCLTLFVDALDECEADQVEEMSPLSTHRYSARPKTDPRASREHEKDIASYIKSKLKVGESKTAKEIKNKVQTNAGGIFMKRLDELPIKLIDLFTEILQRDQKNMRGLQLSEISYSRDACDSAVRNHYDFLQECTSTNRVSWNHQRKAGLISPLIRCNA
ncbi:hypothetical protein QQS21_011998 [Conoideocrella luteorostrata]|uniref:Uncharacterized protein n=1 Tax=Conoideocrella luteorostrata TaxID=1105319 RepID=A0AAJ0FN21_9HYPO|nr:hypothetical protein QQS21_011998 [Conoideocrella luteorostrata]